VLLLDERSSDPGAEVASAKDDEQASRESPPSLVQIAHCDNAVAANAAAVPG
jgi:hypothetical protein